MRKMMFILVAAVCSAAGGAEVCDLYGKESVQREKMNTLKLRLNIKSGEFLQLSDNSVWQVAPCCYKIAAKWLTADPVTVSRSDDPKYPYFIKNEASGTKVMAHHISRLPERP